MKRYLMAIIIVLCLMVCTCTGAEGVLPSLTDTIGKPMPALGEALGRYPDEEITSDDGSNTEVFQSVTETDFNTFSVYLSKQGATLADYQTYDTSFSASIELEGKIISFTYDMHTQKATVTYPKGTYDEWLDYAKTQFASVIQLMDAGNTYEAAEILFSIPQFAEYKPIAEYIIAHPELAVAVEREEKIKQYKIVGSYVTFGTYPQTYGGRDETPIEWLVLDYDIDAHCSLLISRYGLDVKPYTTDSNYIDWEHCSLRTWLNGEFFAVAFDRDEQKAIQMTNVDNSSSQGYNGSKWKPIDGKNTQDKIFILSYAEANKYLGVTEDDSSNMKSRAKPTDYAMSSINPKVSGAMEGQWWLRSLSYETDFFVGEAIVKGDGSLTAVYYTHADSVCVRPVLWIDLESDFF